jgi:hypothetical protein
MPRRPPHPPSASSVVRKVWRFVDYHGRFWADTLRKDIDLQQYIKWYVNAWKGPGGEVLTALRQLARYPNFIELQGAVIELLTVATNTSPEYQGYLLSSRKEPMEASEVGSILRVNGRKALVVLARLDKCGFLEEVPWPPSDSDGPIPDDPSLRLLHDVARAGKRPPGKGGGEGRFRGENAGEPLQNRRRSEDKAAQAMVEVTAAVETPPQGGQAAKALQAAEAVKLRCPRCGHEGQAPKGSAKPGQCTQCGTLVATVPAPTSMTSTDPDAGAGLAGPHGHHAHKATASPQARPPSIVRLQDVWQEIEPNKYSAAGNDFGQQVCAAYGYVAIDGGEYVNEVAHFAKLYDEGLSTLSDFGQQKARAKLLRVAAMLRTGEKHPEAPGAYLERVLQNAIRDQKRANKAKSG